MKTLYMEDCIHLRACRRIIKICRNKYGIPVSRCCTEDCTAYQKCNDIDNATNSEKLYTRDEVNAVMHGACRDGQNGYSPYDCLIEDYID